MNKRILAVIITLVLACTLSSCRGDSNTAMPAPTQEAPDTSAETASDLDTVQSSDTPESASAAEHTPELEYLLNTYTCSYTDSVGYEVMQTLNIGDWVRASDKEMMAAAWAACGGGGQDIPSRESLGIHDSYVVMRNGIIHYDSDEILYAFGTIKAKNITAGFSFTPENTYSTQFRLQFNSHENNDSMYGNHNNLAKMAVLFSNSVKISETGPSRGNKGTFGDNWDGLPTALMTSDSWGSVLFVIAIPEQFNPKNPNGDPSLDECYFVFGGNEFTLGKTYAPDNAADSDS